MARLLDRFVTLLVCVLAAVFVLALLLGGSEFRRDLSRALHLDFSVRSYICGR